MYQKSVLRGIPMTTIQLGKQVIEPNRLRELLSYHAKRCPVCGESNFTSDLKGKHKCFTCGKEFNDETALPSLARLNKEAKE